MTERYKKMLKKGQEYQDFIADRLPEKLGIALSVYKSKLYQYGKGESKQGIEIKFDDVYARTGNLYIEIAEKSNPKNPHFVKSGIYRNNNSWLYLIGNYERAFIFGISILKLYYEDSRFEKKKIPTSIGFLLPEKYHYLALKTLKF